MANPCAESIRVMHPLFQEGQGGSIPTSALHLQFGTIDVRTAMALNKLWHSRLPKTVEANLILVTNRIYYAADFDGKWYAAAIWTSPVSQSISQDRWLELRRFAIAPDAPKNTASRMLGWMAKDIAKRFPLVENLISYQDCEVHQGTIYKAAGWTPTVQNKDKRQAFVRRKNGESRNTEKTTSLKQRWDKRIRIEGMP